MAGTFQFTKVVRGKAGATNPSADLGFIVSGTEAEADVLALVAANASLIYDTLWFEDAEYEHLGGGVWNGTLRYGDGTPKGGEQSFTFDTTGATQNRKQGVPYPDGTQERRFVPAGKTATDFKGAINVHNGQVDGVDVTVPALKFSITKFYDLGDEDDDFLEKLSDMTGTINDKYVVFTLSSGQTISGDVGEIVFRGVTGGQKGSEQAEFTFHFEKSKGAKYLPHDPDNPGLTVGDITQISKAGWDYLWTAYSEGTSTATGSHRANMVPFQVTVNKVCPDGDFDELGLT